MKPSTAENIIMSKLLVLQTKRLLLNGALDRADEHAPESMLENVERLRREADQAQHAYRTAVLSYGSPVSSDYWLVAYGRLIESGTALMKRLRDATYELPPAERYEVSADIEALEGIVDRWTEARRHAMAGAIA
ncbi:MAG TPA: hypothetical protein VJT78_12860 [Candidatus Dormibacteraeota bacterium]|nr:hypothetical protein [Candidatus Dormibacteraeota bacterium]